MSTQSGRMKTYYVDLVPSSLQNNSTQRKRQAPKMIHSSSGSDSKHKAECFRSKINFCNKFLAVTSVNKIFKSSLLKTANGY